MIKNKRMQLLESEDGIDFYLFKPSIFRLYFENRLDDAAHRFTVSHIVHMYVYLLGGGYNILYLSEKDEIVSYLIFTKCKNWIVSESNMNDYYTIFLWTYPQYRNKGFATKMTQFLLQKSGLKFKRFIKTIGKDNKSSVAVAEKSGFKRIGEANKTGLLHKIIPVNKGSCFLYEYFV